MECIALIVKRECMSSELHLLGQFVIRHRERPHPTIDSLGDFRNRRTVSCDRVPHTDEIDVFDRE
jgi:hypothetical protein